MIISCGIVIINDKNQILCCKPYGKNKDRGDLPKGRMEIGEIPIETAIRETREEAGVDLSNEELIDLGEFPYYKGKRLHLFKCNKDIELSSLKCTSYFELHEKIVPEVDGYEFVDIKDIEDKFYYSLVPILKEILK
jgi:8-oxo-dGTP pyrophosphatase MutT (NUDIX family)